MCEREEAQGNGIVTPTFNLNQSRGIEVFLTASPSKRDGIQDFVVALISGMLEKPKRKFGRMGADGSLQGLTSD
jgi:hypothetical protein